MTMKMPSLRNFRNPIGCLILLAAFAAAAGCSNAESPAGSSNNMNHVLPSGSSVSGWLVVPSGGTHTSSATLDYIANGGSSDCTQCHGSDLKGGISGVSCFANPAGCHHGPVVTGWVAAPPAAQQHGVSAKKAPGSSGFASCQICHGADFRIPRGASNRTCYSCHTLTPHAPRPWRGSPYTHTDTNTANAPVCAQCHFPGSPNNPANHPATPAPAGTAPGCFNSTLCHGAGGAPHPVDNAWVTPPPAPQPHGNSAKATPGATTGFSYCQDCHGTGTNFSGGSSGVSCTNTAGCHGATVSSPHPKDWLPDNTYKHNTTSPGNASVCAYCHRNANPGTPGCFNNTLCHGAVVAHPVPYNDASHYAVTSATFPGSCGACHVISGAPVNPPDPNPCRTCHVAGDPTTSTKCSSCHGDPAAAPSNVGAPTGTVYPNLAGTSGSHATHIALNSTGSPISCNTCHNGLGPSLQNLNHYNRANAIPTENAARVPPGDVSFLATYYAKTGSSSFDNSAALNCSNVSCHGGQATPNWQTGALVVNNQCTNCHALGSSQGNPQYNSEYSGKHQFHVNLFGATAVACKVCHNTTTLVANHFTTLSTTAMEGPASATIGGAGTTVTTYLAGSCTPSVGSSGGCHGTRSW